MIKFFYRLLIDLTNNIFISKLIKLFATSKVSRSLIPSFIKAFNIDETEAANPRDQYNSLHDFFIRTLKSDARPINFEPNSVISPVDALVEDIGIINQQKDIVVKGQIFSIKEMLGNDEKFIKYENGIYMILYLSPKDYHRIHSPISGTIRSQWEVGGKSYPVNSWGLKYGRAPLSKNYRMISEVEQDNRFIAIAKVGALFINSITLTHPNDILQKGDEIGYFSFGSTVVLLFEKDCFLPLKELKGERVKMGQRIGVFLQK
ncbi:phosphatidylserine decarboxylase [Calidifontibacillus oryziterrae]|uniref:phosphatidylserine decarboxylase n=1 Tax=Calidifontibacillus oryziterrae TaxID=1191699 RepID=UPI0002E75AC5|nr:phosphatidylserine decarboxylase [Calidifontibacillus oryziterrae]